MNLIQIMVGPGGAKPLMERRGSLRSASRGVRAATAAAAPAAEAPEAAPEDVDTRCTPAGGARAALTPCCRGLCAGVDALVGACMPWPRVRHVRWRAAADWDQLLMTLCCWHGIGSWASFGRGEHSSFGFCVRRALASVVPIHERSGWVGVCRARNLSI
jgi:hypothetical protein